MPVLPDLLREGLKIVFCGTAPSSRSAQLGAYYAHGGNLFWQVLHWAGFTPVRLAPVQYRDLLGYGIGLTDLNKVQSGVDAELDVSFYDPQALAEKILFFRPRILAFTSKNGAQAFYGRGALSFGPQSESIGQTQLWVLPSTSGSARAHWPLLKHYWFELGELFRTMGGRHGRVPARAGNLDFWAEKGSKPVD